MLDAAGDSADHAAIFELVVAAAGSGKDENGKSGMAEDEQFHVAAEAAGIPLVVLAVHGMGWLLMGRFEMRRFPVTVTAKSRDYRDIRDIGWNRDIGNRD